MKVNDVELGVSTPYHSIAEQLLYVYTYVCIDSIECMLY